MNLCYQQVTSASDEMLRIGFADVYKEAFGGAPYFETYETQEVLSDVLNPHTERGVVFVALKDAEVIGFACAMPLRYSPEEIQSYIAKRKGNVPFDLLRTWYMSEVGVLVRYRRQGIGMELIRARLQHIEALGDTHYVFRTAAVGSNSESLYRKINAIEIPGTQDVSATEQVRLNGSQSTQRRYFYGACRDGLEILRCRQS